MLYYNAETRKVLTSCNHTFLTAWDPTPQEGIVIENPSAHEGEQEGTNMHTVEENLLKSANMS